HSDVANSLISGLPLTFDDRRQPGITYGSGLRDEAMVLETLTLMGKRAKAEKILQSMAAQLSQNTWYSTQTTAYSLLAIAEFAGQNKAGQKISSLVRIHGMDTATLSESYIARIPVKFKNGKSDLVVNNK